MADLIKILFFLVGSAALGFLLGRRSRNSDVAVLEAQSAEKQRAFVDVKSKLDRCTAKRANLERELSNRQKGKAISASSAAASPASSQPKTPSPGSQKKAQPTSTSPQAASSKTDRPPKSSPNSASSQSDESRRPKSRGPESRRPESRPSTEGSDDQKKKAKSSSDNKQDEALERVKANAGRVNFDRIGRATEGEKNNLKRIKGIGPFLERKLNALGIYTFAQIANFTDEDKDVVNEAIEFFPGRISRDNWVDQAKKLQQDQKG